ncbi:unnamed protein product [Lampetra fluviatilis]
MAGAAAAVVAGVTGLVVAHAQLAGRPLGPVVSPPIGRQVGEGIPAPGDPQREPTRQLLERRLHTSHAILHGVQGPLLLLL